MSATSVVERLVKAINSKIQGSSKGAPKPMQARGGLIPFCPSLRPLLPASLSDGGRP
jgi:hypothetical protein